MNKRTLIIMYNEFILPKLNEKMNIHYTEVALLINKSASFASNICRMLSLIISDIEYKHGYLSVRTEINESKEHEPKQKSHFVNA